MKKKKTGLNGYVYEFNVDYNPVDPSRDAVKPISYLHKYLMGKYSIR